jgi:hypothetical protein
VDEALANQLVRELADAISAAAAGDPRVEACHAKARACGFELKVALTAAVRCVDAECPPAMPVLSSEPLAPMLPPAAELTAADHRFLKALRIGTGHGSSGSRESVADRDDPHRVE